MLAFVLPTIAMVVGAAVGSRDSTATAATSGVGAFLVTLIGAMTRLVSKYTAWTRKQLDELREQEKKLQEEINEQLKLIDDAIAQVRTEELAAARDVAQKRSDSSVAAVDVGKGPRRQ